MHGKGETIKKQGERNFFLQRDSTEPKQIQKEGEKENPDLRFRTKGLGRGGGKERVLEQGKKLSREKSSGKEIGGENQKLWGGTKKEKELASRFLVRKPTGKNVGSVEATLHKQRARKELTEYRI